VKCRQSDVNVLMTCRSGAGGVHLKCR